MLSVAAKIMVYVPEVRRMSVSSKLMHYAEKMGQEAIEASGRCREPLSVIGGANSMKV